MYTVKIKDPLQNPPRVEDSPWRPVRLQVIRIAEIVLVFSHASKAVILDALPVLTETLRYLIDLYYKEQYNIEVAGLWSHGRTHRR